MRARAGLGVVLGFVVAGACSDGGAVARDALAPGAIAQTLPPHALDVLFVIDRSPSMEAEQASLLASFGRFTEVLEAMPGGMPSLHLGVISSDVGAGGHAVPGCLGDGDDGRLQRAPRVAGCTPPAGAFLAIERDGDGAEVRNFTGSLDDAFACVGTLGTEGCAFGQPLEAMRRALDGRHGDHAGFVRDGMPLAIVLMSDEDDCSAKDPAIYDPAPMGLGDLLGPPGAFRCFEFGVRCGGTRPPRTAVELDPIRGPRLCEGAGALTSFSREPMWHPQVYADFVRGLKRDPGLVIAAGIVGDTRPVRTSTDFFGNPTVSPACYSDFAESAAPAIRFDAFLRAFPGRQSSEIICRDDQSENLRETAAAIVDVLARPCLTGDVDTDGCTARDAAGAEVAFELVVAPEECAAYPTGLAVVLAGGPVATAVTVECPGREGGPR